MQPIKELSSAAGRCAGRGCALIRQLANLASPTFLYTSCHQRNRRKGILICTKDDGVRYIMIINANGTHSAGENQRACVTMDAGVQ